jgi:hypothetical protein
LIYAGQTGSAPFWIPNPGTPPPASVLNRVPGDVSNVAMVAESAPINCKDCIFDLGPIGTSGITNSSAGQLFSGSFQPTTIFTYSQFSGISGFNGLNFPWKIFCSDAACSVGAIQLYAAGTLTASINGSGPSTLPSLTLSAIPSSAGSGGLYVCVDSTGATYKKSSCP